MAFKRESSKSDSESDGLPPKKIKSETKTSQDFEGKMDKRRNQTSLFPQRQGTFLGVKLPLLPF